MANREREGRQKGCKRTQTTAIDVRKDESATSLTAAVLYLAFDAMGAVRSLSVCIRIVRVPYISVSTHILYTRNKVMLCVPDEDEPRERQIALSQQDSVRLVSSSSAA